MQDYASIQKACYDAMKLCEQAETSAKQGRDAADKARAAAIAAAQAREKSVRDTATKTRATARAAAQSQKTQLRQYGDGITGEARTLSSEADRLLSDAQLLPAAPRPYQMPYITTPTDLLGLLADQRSVLIADLARMRQTAQELKSLRRKWWRFW